MNQKYANLIKYSKEKEENIIKLNDELVSLKKELDKIQVKEKIKNLKKIIHKKIFRFNIKKKLKNIIGNITRNKANSIIGNYYIDNFDLEKILALNKDFYDNILDLKTFAKLDSSINENKIILFI